MQRLLFLIFLSITLVCALPAPEAGRNWSAYYRKQNRKQEKEDRKNARLSTKSSMMTTTKTTSTAKTTSTTIVITSIQRNIVVAPTQTPTPHTHSHSRPITSIIQHMVEASNRCILAIHP